MAISCFIVYRHARKITTLLWPSRTLEKFHKEGVKFLKHSENSVLFCSVQYLSTRATFRERKFLLATRVQRVFRTGKEIWLCILFFIRH